ncbi:MAG: hypothetical protein RJA70_2799 [Pseudomonadota bacterium]|jgi:hypothetical protein
MLDIFQQSALAQGNAAKRLMVFIHCNGVTREQWYPDTPGQNFELKFSLQPLERFKNRMIVFGGVDLPSTKGATFSGHTRAGAHLLTCSGTIGTQFGGGGYADHISLDQEIANEIRGMTPIKSLNVGFRCNKANGDMPRARFSYSAPNTPIIPEHRPQLVFDQLSGFVRASDDPAEKAKADRIRAQRLSVLDFVENDLQNTTAALGVDDRARLDEYLTSVRTLEVAVANQVSLICDELTPPGMVDPEADSALVEVTTQMLKLSLHALQCQLTNVAVFQMQGEQSEVQYQDAGHPLTKGLDRGHHYNSHRSGDAIANICALHSTFLADFCADLESTPEGTGTMLDNTIILYTNGIESGKEHNHENLPHVLIGGTNVLQTGQYAKFEGRSTNDLYVTLLQAFGIDKNTFGRPDLVPGVLPGILA